MAQNKEVSEGLNRKVFSSINVEAYQMGVAASIPLFLKLPASKVKIVSSLQYGDSETLLEVDFSHAVYENKRKGKFKILENNYQ